MPRRPLRPVLALAAALALATGASASPATAAPEPRIWGVVLDGTGAALLDVKVKASDGEETVASDLSYDDPDGDQAPRPGFFELYVGAPGTYTVTLKKAGYQKARIPGVQVRRHHRVVAIGEITLLRTTTTHGRSLGAVAVGKRPKVEVSVDPAAAKPTGKVKLKLGKQVVGGGSLARSDKGVLTVRLDALGKGTHRVKAVYAGNTVFATSSSKEFAVRVTGKRPQQRTLRPNAVAGA